MTDYWNRCAEGVIAEYEQLCATQREEIRRLQNKCQDLQLEKVMQRAAAAYDFKEYAVEHATPGGVVPLGAVLSFVQTYSDGMISGEDPRPRPAAEFHEPQPVAQCPSPLRCAFQRLVQAGKKRAREEEFIEEGCHRELLFCP